MADDSNVNNRCINPFQQYVCDNPPSFGPAETYPNQFEYGQDLVWLIKAYKYLLCQYNKVVGLINEVMERLEVLDNLDQMVNDVIQKLMVPIYTEIGQLKNDIKEFENATDDKLAEMGQRIERTTAMVTSLEAAMNGILPAANAYADSKDTALRTELYRYINNFVKEWPVVQDPTDGLLEDINTALRHLYNAVVNGITYGQLTGYGILYQAFNQMNITYDQFNRSAKDFFDNALDSRFYMFSPIDGQYLMWREVIWQLYRLHYQGETFEQWDAAGMTYEDFDTKEITYDDFNKEQWISA